VNDEAVGWLRQVIEGDLAEAKGLLSKDWGDRAWAVTACSDTGSGYCLCIVHQGEYKLPGEAQAPPIRYIADAESPELAAWIAKHDLRSAIARCEAELAILDEHAEGWQIGDPLRDCQWETWPCRTLRLVASGYRHREGYAQHWGEVSPR
jgi:hypothetical protein